MAAEQVVLAAIDQVGAILRSGREDLDIRDVDRFETLTRRFARDFPNYNQQQLVSRVVECLVWRKSSRVRDLHPGMFPKEILLTGTIGRDAAGGVMILARPGMYRKLFADFAALSLDYEAYMREGYFDEENVTIFLDLRGASLASIDLDYATKGHALALNYPGQAFKSVIAFGVPTAIVKLLKFFSKKMYSKEVRKRGKLMTTEDALAAFGKPEVDSQVTATRNSCLSVEEVGLARGWSAKQITMVQEHFERYKAAAVRDGHAED